ncbi:acyltransferase [Wenzhouxiangella limi]|uniref:Acyltransferase n=1 Tax=Wenzhouxiangella limi TaxID=2707351 RepID=A0A845V1L3_9GAMM|nr:acyltransferase [Wenzhouxiangella limi]NDY94171.1 acyltransferase [Wenzhouxiangella limi]
MIHRIGRSLRIVGATMLLTLNSLVHVAPLMTVALVKALLRVEPVRRICDRWLMALVASWIDVNSWMMDHLTHLQVSVEGLPDAMPNGRFLMLCNHQSWVDIPVLQKVFNRRLPMLRFFLKSQLIWVPILGLAWWALDFPFMKRYTREQIARRPELAGRDIEATRKACRKYRDIPVVIGAFVEGTRFMSEKHAAQNSPYKHLLKPRAGGTAFVLDAMGEVLDGIIDVTLVYPHGRGELFDLFADRIPEVRVNVRVLPVPPEFKGRDYHTDQAFRRDFQNWLNELWTEKDATIQRLLERAAH